MAKTLSTDSIIQDLEAFLKRHRKANLITTYLFYLEKKFNIQPIVFIPERKIYESHENLLQTLEKEDRLYRETEIKIQFSVSSVNKDTKRIYICPFSGKVFGDNTHPNPQDAIYDWVSKCKENTLRENGMRVKKFHISEDPEIIASYIQKEREGIVKTVFSSKITKKLFANKKAIKKEIEDNFIQPIELKDVPMQNRFEIEDKFLEYIQNQLEEDHVSTFVESLSPYPYFEKHIERWSKEAEEEASEEEDS